MYADSNKDWRARIVPWQASQLSQARPQLILLSGSVGLVTLIGCSNVAMLLLVQGARRSRELAVRAALGAGRRRIVSQLLTESLVLSLVAGAVGVGLATWWVSLFARFGPREIPRLSEAAIRVRRYFEDVLARLEARPDVHSAAATLEIPLSGGRYRVWRGFELRGHPDTGREKTLAVSNSVTPHFFAAMEIPLRAGRGLTEHDDAGAAPVVVVSEAFAQTFLTGQNPLGQRIRFESDTAVFEIVGVVGDVKPDGLDSRPNPTVYRSFAQDPKPFMAIVIRTRTEPEALAATIGGELLKIDPDVPPYRVRTAAELVARSLGSRRFRMMLMTAFAAGALGLALVGLNAVVSSLVAQRTREIGLRVALGASRGNILGPVLRQAVGPSCIGLVLGTALAALAAPAMRHFLYGVEPLDPVVMLLGPAALAAACVLACLVPALRALRVDPVIALRAE
jgi:predicted permease